MKQGTVRWFSYSNGCGFIVPECGGADVFAHFSGFRDTNLRFLYPNQRVRYRVSEGPKGAVARDARDISLQD